MGLSEKLGKTKATEEEITRLWNYWEKECHHIKGEFEEFWPGYNTLSDETSIPIFVLKRIMKIFRDSGIAYHAHTYRDYEIGGSGNFIKEEYQGKTWDEIKEML
jgi:hypothetical protein